VNNILNKRRAGILLHITSLPGAGAHGDLGREAYHFVKFLHDAGVTVWQVLPLGMTHNDGSPYQCLSAHAGNPALINIDWLAERGWLNPSEQCEECACDCVRQCLLTKAYYGFLEHAEQQDKEHFKRFCKDKAFWLDDFSLFLALRNEFNQQCWNQWPEPLKHREPEAVKKARSRLKKHIDCIKFEQYVFFRQWLELKYYANQQGVFLFGDIPIFVSYDSADVWSHRDRGLEAAWEIPASEDTAVNGLWAKAPGHALLKAIKAEHGQIPLVAEDLGIITPEVEALRDDFALPGMKILQFAFGGDSDNPYLPDNYDKNCVVYTGTHDNDTTLGWLSSISHDERNYIYNYLGCPTIPLHCALIHSALGSVANLAVIPMQDILELGSEHRMNTPGTSGGNWKWRFQWDQLSTEKASRFTHLVGLFNRK